VLQSLAHARGGKGESIASTLEKKDILPQGEEGGSTRHLLKKGNKCKGKRNKASTRSSETNRLSEVFIEGKLCWEYPS